MELNKTMRIALVDEIKSVVQKMKDTNEPVEKAYFFSAIPAHVIRIINFKYDQELSFLSFVLAGAHQQISSRVISLSKQQDRPISIPSGLFDKLEHELEILASKIENDEQIYQELVYISHLAYTTSGNGYYLYLMDRIKL